MGSEQGLEGLRPDERAITTEHKDVVIRGRDKRGPGLIHRMSGSQLFGLLDELDVVRAGETRSHQFSLESNHHHDPLGARGSACVHDPVKHRTVPDLVHHLRQVALHPSSLARGEDHGVDDACIGVERM